MKAIKQAQLNKSRSYTACIAEAHKIFFNNIKLIFRNTWIYSLIYSLISASYLSLYISSILYGNIFTQIAGIATSSLLIICAHIAYISKVMQFINKQSLKWNIIRNTRLTLFYICFILSSGFIFGLFAFISVKVCNTFFTITEMQMFFTISFIIFIIWTFMILPFVYVFMKYTMEPESKLRDILFKSYKTGLRQWGFIFITCMLAYLLFIICTILVSIPTLILLMANIMSVYGANYIGDPSGLPEYFGVIRFSTITITSFIGMYIYMFIIFVYYFIYGSIKTREMEKNEFLKKQS